MVFSGSILTADSCPPTRPLPDCSAVTTRRSLYARPAAARPIPCAWISPNAGICVSGPWPIRRRSNLKPRCFGKTAAPLACVACCRPSPTAWARPCIWKARPGPSRSASATAGLGQGPGACPASFIAASPRRGDCSRPTRPMPAILGIRPRHWWLRISSSICPRRIGRISWSGCGA